VFTNLIKIAVKTKIFSIFTSHRLAEPAVQTGEFAVTHGDPTDNFLKKRLHE
jgi:hypothetical protein